MDISHLTARSKEYELLTVKYDPQYESILAAIDITKKFIIDNGSIIYGGSAIDYALRLKGDKLYPDGMLAIPDLDFYSQDSVKHSYQLADILYHNGFKESRAINAQHMETMRVDVVDNHFIADITYRPKDIFDKLPFLEYAGMKIIHPWFQRIDVHSSLSFPYDNSPQEVIFSRLAKDIKSFNLLNKYYPIIIEGELTPMMPAVAPVNIFKHILNGFIAYAFMYHDFVSRMTALKLEIPLGIIPAKLEIGEKITFDALCNKIDILHFDIERAAADLGMQVRKYEPYINMIPMRVEGVIDDTTVAIYSTAGRLVAVNSMTINDKHFRIVNVQYLLQYFISIYFANTGCTAMTYLSRYQSLLNMISAMESAYKGVIPENCALFPSTTAYGNENINLARQIALNRLYNTLDDVPLYKIPQNYYPDRKIPRGLQHPDFDPESVEFFHESGREITAA